MKPALQCFWRARLALLASTMFCLGVSAQAEPLTLKRAVDLALVHSPTAGQAAADEQRAVASYREMRDQFIPQLLIGSGLGGTWGYPLTLGGTAPSIVNITAQSALFNPALKDGLRSGRSEIKATQEEMKDRRSQIIQDTTLNYLELLKWQQMTDHLQQQHDDAAKMEQAVQQRIAQGIDSQQQLMQARLVTARANLHMAQAQGAIDVLRDRLSQLTGLPASSIDAVADSVPAVPQADPPANAAEKAAESNPAVASAQEHAVAEQFRARAEHRALWPSVDFASQYAVLAKYNNWATYFPAGAFQRNNASVGVVVRFPFFNASQHAHAESVDAEALRARKEVESTKHQVSQQVLKLQHSVEQLQAAQQVSELEYEIAKANADAVKIRMNSGTATIHDDADARSDMYEKYNSLQDANFELLKAQVGLLRATGDLDSWVEGK
ncbi:MAG TPA: TolC family protein [Terriglobales bacterium]